MNPTSVIESVPALAFGFAGGWEIVVVGGIALLLFGNRLPGAAKSLGMSFSAFKKGIKEGEESVEDSPASTSGSVENASPPEKVESQS